MARWVLCSVATVMTMSAAVAGAQDQNEATNAAVVTGSVVAETPFTWTTNSDNTITVAFSKHEMPIGVVVIPHTINHLPVTCIGTAGFSCLFGMIGVIIPNSVTNIQEMAFLFCNSLTNLVIPDGVASIGNSAFRHCIGLTNISIPSSVVKIGDNVFNECRNLTVIETDKQNPLYMSLEGVLFDKKEITIIQFPAGKTGEYLIPPTVTTIGQQAFEGCVNLTSVTIPDSVSNVGRAAFFFCTNLTSMTIPGSVASIGDGAFNHCTNLREVYFKGNAPVLNQGVFSDAAENQTAVYFQGYIPQGYSLKQDVFYGTTNATVYYLEGSTGWDSTFGGRPTAVWKPQDQGDTVSGVRTK